MATAILNGFILNGPYELKKYRATKERFSSINPKRDISVRGQTTKCLQITEGLESTS
jgi:hypothetical protein